eukprot:TRINITY_DN5745_c0_g1_i1.p1 TRINITY_DN5745_c0_g1~~TRINITY_DN5745_c0_g1_i1.p1  ORF type:complete len:232 (+),score=73.45 TRINITY_DN5745_c0_g1_i1:104-799(+)
MIRRPPRSTLSSSSAASDVYKRQYQRRVRGVPVTFIMEHVDFHQAPAQAKVGVAVEVDGNQTAPPPPTEMSEPWLAAAAEAVDIVNDSSDVTKTVGVFKQLHSSVLLLWASFQEKIALHLERGEVEQYHTKVADIKRGFDRLIEELSKCEERAGTLKSGAAAPMKQIRVLERERMELMLQIEDNYLECEDDQERAEVGEVVKKIESQRKAKEAQIREQFDELQASLCGDDY